MVAYIDIIIFPFHDWKKCERQGWNERDAHLLLELDKSPFVRKILVVDRPISIPEIVRYPKNWKAKKGKLVYWNGNSFLTQVSDKTFVLDQVVFEILKPRSRHHWWLYIMRAPKTIQNIRHSVQYLSLRNKVLWLANPFATDFIGAFDEKIFVFDAIDRFTEHPGMFSVKEEISQAYCRIKQKADIIFTVSQELRQFLGEGRANVFQIPNAVDMHFFKKAKNICPHDLRSIKKPIAGHIGQTEGKIDIDLMEYLALNIPDVNFVFVGRTGDKKSVQPLFRHSNIFFLGEKHYSVIPLYLSHFDVCLLPHKVDEFTKNMDPQKVYEYLAMGKPVVSTPVSGVEAFQNVIHIAKGKEGFVPAIRESLNDDPELIKRRIEAVRLHSWRNRVETMLQHIMEAIAARERKLQK